MKKIERLMYGQRQRFLPFFQTMGSCTSSRWKLKSFIKNDVHIKVTATRGLNEAHTGAGAPSRASSQSCSDFCLLLFFS